VKHLIEFMRQSDLSAPVPQTQQRSKLKPRIAEKLRVSISSGESQRELTSRNKKSSVDLLLRIPLIPKTGIQASEANFIVTTDAIPIPKLHHPEILPPPAALETHARNTTTAFTASWSAFATMIPELPAIPVVSKQPVVQDTAPTNSIQTPANNQKPIAMESNTNLTTQPVVARRTPTTFELHLQKLREEQQGEDIVKEFTRTLHRDIHNIEHPLVALSCPDEPRDSAILLLRLAMRWSAESKQSVLLVDSAYNTTTLTQELEFSTASGLNEVLLGKASLRETIQPTYAAGIDFMPHGQPTTFDMQPAWNTLLKEFRELKQYGLILFDVGTLLAPKSVVLARLADAAYLTICLGATPVEIANQCVQRLRQAGGEFLGCVVR
jgi:Mrp family chromosome partitioning ATPase